MRIQFVIPNFKNRTKEYLIIPSIEICIMSQILKDEGHIVNLIDMRINDYKSDDLRKLLKDFNPDIVCVDDIPDCHCYTKEILPIIKNNISAKSKLCMRGEIATFEPKMVLDRNPEIDFLLRYETDYVINEIVEYMENKRSIESISNIAFRSDNQIILTEIKSVDLTLLPLPDRTLYDIPKYLSRDSETIVKSSRGCPGKCLFCIKTKFEPFKLFSMSRFCTEIEALVSLGFKSFFFSDNNFAVSMTRLYEFANEIHNRNIHIRWTSNLRIIDITDEKIELMKKLGAYRVFVGIETLNSRTSENIKKNLSRKEIIDKLDILKKHKMQFHASFILGNPGDCEEDLQETLDFVKEVKPDLVTFNVIKIYPGLDLYNNPNKYNMIMDDSYWFEKDEWTKKVIMGTKQLSPETIEKWSKKMLYEYVMFA